MDTQINIFSLSSKLGFQYTSLNHIIIEKHQ